MSYQQRVYHWMLRYPDPVTMHEICRGTNLPPLVVSYALHRMHKRLGLVRPNRSNGGRGIKWLIVDDTITFIPDNRGMMAGSRAALVRGGRRVDKVMGDACIDGQAMAKYRRQVAPARNVTVSAGVSVSGD